MTLRSKNERLSHELEQERTLNNFIELYTNPIEENFSIKKL